MPETQPPRLERVKLQLEVVKHLSTLAAGAVVVLPAIASYIKAEHSGYFIFSLILLWSSLVSFGFYLSVVIWNYADDPNLPIKGHRTLFGIGWILFLLGMGSPILDVILNLHA